MKESELNSLYYIEKRISRLRHRIAELNMDISAIKYTGLPHGNEAGRPLEEYIVRKDELVQQLTQELNKKLAEELKIRRYLENVEDEEVKAIMEMRFIHLMGWFEISEELHMERTTAAKKMRKYLREH